MTTSIMGGTFSGNGYLGILTIFGLMAVTIYMAFGFPYTLFHLKQTETTEIQSVIIIGSGGEQSPSADSYFIGEEPPEELHKIGYNMLTNTGKERMYLLGKFLKLRYYHLLLNGNPRGIHARAAATDRHLESAQALLAGLNPPKDDSLWSSTGEMNNWQPKAVHSTAPEHDDLLSVEPNCFKLEQDKLIWKNSSRYQQLLIEFRHDLQTLRANTGLEFEDDLEMLSSIEDALKTRKAFKENVPAWYTNTFANRLSHIADVTTESRYNSAIVQRLFVGRLLHEFTEKINTRILLHQQALADSELNDRRQEIPEQKFPPSETQKTEKQPQLLVQQTINVGKSSNMIEPSILVYITDKQRLAALMSSLQIYSSEPRFGSLLIIELHYDPINHLHFLRLFMVSSSSPNSFPEPLRVNPIACIDSVECAPQQFEQNIRHLMLDRGSWQEACLSSSGQTIISTTSAPMLPLINDDLSNQPLQEIPLTTTATTISSTSTTSIPLDPTTAMPPTTITLDVVSEEGETRAPEKLEEELIVGPIRDKTPEADTITDVKPDSVAIEQSDSSTQAEIESTSVVVEESSTTTPDTPIEVVSVSGEVLEPAGGKTKDITSAIEFQNFPSSSRSDDSNSGENLLDAMQTETKKNDKESLGYRNHHTSDI